MNATVFSYKMVEIKIGASSLIGMEDPCSKGAFLHCLVSETCEDKATDLLRATLVSDGYELVSAGSLSPVELVRNNEKVEPEMADLIDFLMREPAVWYGEFHCYGDD